MIDDDAGVRAAAGEEGFAAWLDARAASDELGGNVQVIEDLLEVNVADDAADAAFRKRHSGIRKESTTAHCSRHRQAGLRRANRTRTSQRSCRCAFVRRARWHRPCAYV